MKSSVARMSNDEMMMMMMMMMMKYVYLVIKVGE